MPILGLRRHVAQRGIGGITPLADWWAGASPAQPLQHLQGRPVVAAAGIVLWTVYALIRRIPTGALFDRLNPRLLIALTVVWLGYSLVRAVSIGLGQDYFALVVA